MKRSTDSPSKKIRAFLVFALVGGILVLITYSLLNTIVLKTTNISDYSLISEQLLGLKGKKNILVLFMNNAEMRYGGGFIGTVGYFSVDNGKITPEPVRSVYYYDYKYKDIDYKDSLAEPRAEDGAVNLRNSGRNLNWPFNGKRAKDIFELETGKSVDMVVAVTPAVLNYSLGQLGNVKLDDYNLTVTQNNLIDTLQMEVEQGQDKRSGKDPKSILTSLGNEITKKLSDKNLYELVMFSAGLKDLSDRRQIILYSKSYDMQQALKRTNLDGSLVSFAGDFFTIAEDNISIDKSSAYIDRTLSRNISVDQNGTVKVSVQVKRLQTRDKSLDYVDPHSSFTFLIKENKSQIKLAIPKGSKVTPGEGTPLKKVAGEGGNDIYEFQSDLTPKLESNYNFSYILPTKLALSAESTSVDSFLQIQNGGWPYRLVQSVSMPEGWHLVASNQKTLYAKSNETIYDKIVDKDELISLVYAKK